MGEKSGFVLAQGAEEGAVDGKKPPRPGAEPLETKWQALESQCLPVSYPKVPAAVKLKLSVLLVHGHPALHTLSFRWSLLLACLKQYRSRCPDCSSTETWWVPLLGVLAARMWPSWATWLRVWKGWWTSWAGRKSCRISSSGRLGR